MAIFLEEEVGLGEAVDGIAVGVGDGDVDDFLAGVDLEGGGLGADCWADCCERAERVVEALYAVSAMAGCRARQRAEEKRVRVSLPGCIGYLRCCGGGWGNCRWGWAELARG